MLLGSRKLAVGDTRRYVVSYCNYLQRGMKVKSVTVTALPQSTGLASTSTITQAYVENDGNDIIFYVQAGVLNEAFTAQVVVITTDGETVNDTVDFLIVAP